MPTLLTWLGGLERRAVIFVAGSMTYQENSRPGVFFTSSRRCGEGELARAGAFRFYRDTTELRESLHELGVL